MKKNVILLVALFVLMAVGVSAQQADPESDFQVMKNENSVTITKYIGKKREVRIPDRIQDLPVTGIGKEAFKSFTGTSIMIPDSVTNIGDSAFSYCTFLTSITIPNGVTSIGKETFLNCQNLTIVNIPNSINNIGEYAFNGCWKLASITIPYSLTSIGKSAFSCSSITSVSIPSSVTSIGDGAFSSCSKLTSVIIPDSVTVIEKDAFNSCENLASVTIGNGVTSIIGGGNFLSCPKLTSVTFNCSIKQNYMSNTAFDGDLVNKYFMNSGGMGTYKRPDGKSKTWAKQ